MNRELEALLQRLPDLLADPVCVVDEAGVFVFVSAAGERVFGYPAAEMVGRVMMDFVHPDDRERTREVAARVMAGQPYMHFENRYIRKDGSIAHIEWSASWSAKDRFRLGIARDVTETKRAERRQRALLRISQATHASDDLVVLCRHVRATLEELLSAPPVRLAVSDPEQEEAVTWIAPTADGDGAPTPQALERGSLVARVLRTGRADQDEEWSGFPLLSPAGVVGVLMVPAGSDGWDANEERELFEFVADQLATVVERNRNRARLQYLAHHDPLTGLTNRALFRDRLEIALARAHRDGECVAVLYVDVDDFKSVNDSRGHAAGDRLLCALAERLAVGVRESDSVARIGGDEFTVLLGNVEGPAGVEAVIEKVGAALDEPVDLDGESVPLRASIGVALYPRDGLDAEALMKHADSAMYARKRSRPD